MADFTNNEKLNLILKLILGIQGLSNTDDATGLRWYEEQYPWETFLLNNEIWVKDVPTASNSTEADTNVTNNSDFLEKRLIKLSLVPGTNGRAWLAYSTYNDPNSTIIGDWILPAKFGKGYIARLYQDDGTGTNKGTEITTTEGAWIPLYKLGGIILADGYTASDMSWNTPLWIEVYRYKGPKGISGATAGVSLDDAYNNGNSITADENPVVISASNNYAPLQLTNLNQAPTVGLQDGQLAIINKLLYYYDSSKGVWLSTSNLSLLFSSRFAKGNYLSTTSHNGINGFIVPTDAVITGIIASVSKGNMSKSFKLQVDDDTKLTFTLSSGTYYNIGLNIPVNSNEIIKIYAPADEGIAYNPRIDLILQWRIQG